MNLFDIIGPVMVGPSSSHTAGVVRIGNFVNQLCGGMPQNAVVRFYGSFAGTYRGHGSDKAIIAGMMGFTPDDERIRRSLQIARDEGFSFRFETAEALSNMHPNTIEVESGDIMVRGESVGGGNIVIRRIKDIELKFDGRYDTLIVNHRDHRGVIAFVAGVLAHEEINIARMMVYRSRKGGDAIMVIETDGSLDKSLERVLTGSRHIKGVTVVRKLV